VGDGKIIRKMLAKGEASLGSLPIRGVSFGGGARKGNTRMKKRGRRSPPTKNPTDPLEGDQNLDERSEGKRRGAS